MTSLNECDAEPIKILEALEQHLIKAAANLQTSSSLSNKPATKKVNFAGGGGRSPSSAPQKRPCWHRVAALAGRKCPKGTECPFSHDDKIIKEGKQRIEADKNLKDTYDKWLARVKTAGSKSNKSNAAAASKKSLAGASVPTSGKVVLGTFAAVRVGRPSAAPAESFYLSDDKWAAQARAGSSPRLDGNKMSAGATAPRECCSPRAQAQVGKVSAALAAATTITATRPVSYTHLTLPTKRIV